MSEFEDKLKRAIERGQEQSLEQARQEQQQQLTEDEYRRKHTDFRLAISDQIELLMKQVVDHLPGFEYETVYGEKGWGGAISRDDIQIADGKRAALFSRLEITVRPYSDVHVVDLNGKGTVRNQEVYFRNLHKLLDEAELDLFLSAVDQWVLDYAEQYANKS